MRRIGFDTPAKYPFCAIASVGQIREVEPTVLYLEEGVFAALPHVVPLAKSDSIGRIVPSLVTRPVPIFHKRGLSLTRITSHS